MPQILLQFLAFLRISAKLQVALLLVVALPLPCEAHARAVVTDSLRSWERPLPTLPKQPIDRPGMPREVRDAYRWWDSVMLRKTGTGFVAALRERNAKEVVQHYVPRFNAMIAYDPVLFESFLMRAGDDTARYWGEPGVVWTIIRHKACEALGHASPSYLVLNSDYLLHVRVMKVADDTDVRAIRSRRHQPLNACVVEAKVLGDERGDHSSMNGRHIRFYYAPSYPIGRGDCDMLDMLGSATYGRDVFAPGSEYLVFLRIACDGDRSGHRAISLLPSNTYDDKGGVYEVRDGRLDDPTEFFGAGMHPDLKKVRARLRTIRAALSR